ncbi:hypothetical protein [Pseudomonas vancouverensis]|nr:hypothetical protein [Pseudomonas vancouverensis]SDV08141.1 hypothetical protein SAMN05216558_2840 [Pseudomonas vancouverensis]
MAKQTMIKFFAAYLTACVLLQWGVAQASPWIASHVLLKWIL